MNIFSNSIPEVAGLTDARTTVRSSRICQRGGSARLTRGLSRKVAIALILAAPALGLLGQSTAQTAPKPAQPSPPAQPVPTCQSLMSSTPQQLTTLAAQVGKPQLMALAASCLNTSLSTYAPAAGQLASLAQQVDGFGWKGQRFGADAGTTSPGAAAAIAPTTMALGNMIKDTTGALKDLNSLPSFMARSADVKQEIALLQTILGATGHTFNAGPNIPLPTGPLGAPVFLGTPSLTQLQSQLPSVKQLAETAVDEARDQMSAETLLGLGQAVCSGETISSQLTSRAAWLSGPIVTEAHQRADAVFQKMVVAQVPNAAQYQAAFSQAKAGLCKAVNALARVYARVTAYQDCVTNGYVLKSFSTHTSHHAAGYTRHSDVAGALTYKCGYVKAMATGGTTPDQVLSWNSTFKWSDDNPRALNIISSIRDANTDQSACDKVKLCIPISDRASMCMGVKDASSSSATILLGAKIRWRDENKNHCLPPFTVPSLGYLAELEQLGDSQKQQLAQQLQTQLINTIKAAIPIDQQTVALLNAIYQLYLLA